MKLSNNIDWSVGSDLTDKFSNTTGDPSTGHTYISLYEKYLPTSKRILEIGTCRGGFILFCKNQLNDIFYVGADNGECVSKDINETNHWTSFDENGKSIVKNYMHNKLADDFFVGDAYSDEFFTWLDERGYTNSFDLVIDDGPHTIESQVWMIQKSAKLLSENGVYICEDIQEGLGGAEFIVSASPYGKEKTHIWDGLSSGRVDDLCVVIDTRKVDDNE